MKRNSVKVCIRTRPTQNFAQNNIIIDAEHGTIQITADQPKDNGGMANNKENSFKFRFDHVFHNASQSNVYDLFARDTVQGVVDGINGAIMSYGQTGSGKTFTMIGDTSNYEHRGVAPRTLNQLYGEINSRIEFEFRVSCTYMEIYNERIYDLLNDFSNPDQAHDYTIAEEKDCRGTFVRGLTEIEVNNENEALNLLFSGELTRTTATHKLNRKSNRSHSLFTIYLQQRQRSGVSERVVHSKLILVDLAGSERLKKTMDEGIPGSDVTRKESMSINQSLTYLEQCVVALARKGSSHIPYRQSKLTNILKDCLGANCNTLMLSCIWGEAAHLEETISTLRLASRMMRVQNETTMVETIDPSALIKKQAKIIKALKQELLMHDALVERTGMKYEPYTPEQQAGISQMLEKYVDTNEQEEEDHLNINSFREMLEVCKQFKKMVLSARADALAGSNYVGSRPDTGFRNGGLMPADYRADSKIADEYDPNAPLVGESQSGNGQGGFSLGATTSDSRPAGGVEGISMYAENKSTMNPSLRAKDGSPDRKNERSSKFDLPQDSKGGKDTNFLDSVGQGALFESYTRAEGHEFYTTFAQCKSEIKQLRLKSRECSSAVNEAKGTIDRLHLEVEARKSSRIELLRKSGLKSSETEDIVDEEEFRLMKQLQEAKRSYKNGYEQLQKYKNSISQKQVQADQAKNELANGFMKWSGANTQDMGMTSGGGDMGGADQLDDQEAFDRLEVERVMSNDPESLAFFNAQKTRRAHMTQNGSSIRNIQKTKRLN
jgi:kinesin family protein 6/9